MPPETFLRTPFFGRAWWRVPVVGMVELDVPSQDLADSEDGLWAIEQFEEDGILADEIVDTQRLVRSLFLDWTKLFVESIHHCFDAAHEIRWYRVGHHDESVALEGEPFGLSESVV